MKYENEECCSGYTVTPEEIVKWVKFISQLFYFLGSSTQALINLMPPFQDFELGLSWLKKKAFLPAFPQTLWSVWLTSAGPSRIH